MIFMSFKVPHRFDDGSDTIYLQLDHIASVMACDEQCDRTIVEMDSENRYEVDGFVDDILKEIVNEYRER